MDTHSQTGQLIEDTTRRILQVHCTPERLKAAEGAWDETLWQALVDAGLTTALEPASSSMDSGVPIEDALRVPRVAGSYAAPVPLAETLLAHWLIKSAGIDPVEGALSIAPVNREDRLQLQRSSPSGEWRLRGVATRVPWARYAAALVVVAESDKQSFLALVPAKSFASITPGENLAREPRDTVAFDCVLDNASVVSFAPGHRHVYALGAAMRVMQIAGALDAVMRLTVQYVQQRKQFGRPISKFQAVQQNVAMMAANTAAAKAAANSIARIIAKGESGFGIAAAKLRANEAATITSKLAHQVHGAIGYTQEYELHYLTKRLWSWRDEFGNEAVWGRELGAAVCERDADELWDFITAAMD